ncbi:MAG: TIGR01459 family HAD-type hydrolase [Sneathiella sp.]
MSIEIIPGLAPIADRYDAFILDLWGVVHNGEKPFEGALECMAELRRGGRPVMLLSNAPRPNKFVVEFLEGIGVARDCYDMILTSGDMTRIVLEEKLFPFLEGDAKKFYQLGAVKDKGLDFGLDYSRASEIETADFIICTGLVNDEIETPEDYRTLLTQAVQLKLPMLCANPDLTVMRGDRMIFCAGSLAQLYSELGGDVQLFGKPYPRTYVMAKEVLGLAGTARILAVGDSMRTDIKGANNAGIDNILIATGIHADEWGLSNGQAPSAVQVEELSKLHGFSPTFAAGQLRW